MEYQDNPEFYGGCAGILIGAPVAWCSIGALIFSNGQTLSIGLIVGGALLLILLLLRILYAWIGPRGIICAIIALLIVGGLVTMGTMARFNLKF